MERHTGVRVRVRVQVDQAVVKLLHTKTGSDDDLHATRDDELRDLEVYPRLEARCAERQDGDLVGLLELSVEETIDVFREAVCDVVGISGENDRLRFSLVLTWM